MDNPLVSILIVSYNRKEDIARCLQSIRQQTYSPIETVVLDNGSQDGSAELLEREYPEVRLIKMPKNYGDWEGRDIALANCHGELLFSLDDDAEAEPDALETLVRRLLTEPELAVVQARVMDPKTGYTYQTGLGDEYAEREHYMANFLGGAALFRTKTLRDAGGFPHYLLGGAEAHLTFRFLDLGYRILYYPQAIIHHHFSPTSRIPYQRLYLSSKQRLRAIMGHYPGVFRPMLELGIKLWSYSVAALKRGYVHHLVKDLPRLFIVGLLALRGPWKIRQKTLNTIDFLQCHPVPSLMEYSKIPSNQSHLISIIRKRLRWRRDANLKPSPSETNNV